MTEFVERRTSHRRQHDNMIVQIGILTEQMRRVEISLDEMRRDVVQVQRKQIAAYAVLRAAQWVIGGGGLLAIFFALKEAGVV